MKNLRILAALALMIGISSPASAILITTLGEVGSLDTILGVTRDATVDVNGNSCGSGSNPAVEECWGESVLASMNIDLTYEGNKGETIPVFFGTGAESEIAAFQLIDQPLYYIIKNTNSGWVLMQNNDDLNFGVIDSADSRLDGLGNKGNFLTTGTITISHVTEFNSNSVPDSNSVPEPTTLALLGTGMFCFGLNRRRQKRRK